MKGDGKSTTKYRGPPGAQALVLAEELKRVLAERGVALHEVLASRLGLTATDLKCLELVRRPPAAAALTAGELAECAGLTTGAVTGVLDRLEHAGFVRREKSPSDRRKVRVRIASEREPELEALLAPVHAAWLALCASYSEAELARLRAFVARVGALYESQIALAREASATELASARMLRELAAPRGRVRVGALELPQGLAHASLSAHEGSSLYRLRFDGFEPKLSVQAGRVRLQPSRPMRAVDARRAFVALELNGQIPWSLFVRGGVSELRADLRGLELRAFEVVGGAAGLVLELPEPKGGVIVRFAGGVNRLQILRPKGAAARLYISHGASGLRIDGVRHGGAGGELRWQTPEYARAADRYDIEVLGGANDLSLGVG